MDVYVINTALRSRNRHAADISIGGQKVRPGQRFYISKELIAEELDKLGQLEAGGLIELRNAQTGNLVSVSDFVPKTPTKVMEEKLPPAPKVVLPKVTEEKDPSPSLVTDRPPSVSELLGLSAAPEPKPIAPPTARVFPISGGEEPKAETKPEVKPKKERRNKPVEE